MYLFIYVLSSLMTTKRRKLLITEKSIKDSNQDQKLGSLGPLGTGGTFLNISRFSENVFLNSDLSSFRLLVF